MELFQWKAAAFFALNPVRTDSIKVTGERLEVKEEQGWFVFELRKHKQKETTKNTQF